MSEDYTESENNNKAANKPPSPLLIHSKFSDGEENEKKAHSFNVHSLNGNDHSQVKRGTGSSLARGKSEDLPNSSFAKRKNEFYRDNSENKKLKKPRSQKDKSRNQSLPTFHKVNLSRKSLSKPLAMPTPQGLKVINDLTHFETERLSKPHSGFIQCFLRRIKSERLIGLVRRIFSKIPDYYIDEYSTFDIIWEMILGFLILLCFYVQVLEFGFGQEIVKDSPKLMVLFDTIIYLCFIFYLFDMGLKFNRNFIKNSSFIKNRLKKAKRYVFSIYFPIDLLTNISLLNQNNCGLENSTNCNQVYYGIKIIFLLKLIDLRRIIQKFQKIFRDNQNLQLSFIIVKLSIYFFVITHIYSCLFNKLVVRSDEEYIKSTFKNTMSISAISWQNTYLLCLFYTCSSYLRFRSNTLFPNTTEEYFMTSILNLGSFVFLVKILFDIILTILNNLDENKSLRENVRILGHYMKRKKLNIKLKMKMWNHLEKILIKEKELDIPKEDALISKMSSIIKAEVTYSEKFMMIKNEPFFSNNFNLNTLAKITDAMLEKRAFPEEIVLTESYEMGLILITSGTIEVISNTWKDGKQEIIGTLKPGEVFGKYSLITNLPQQFVLKSKNYSTFYLLNRSEFIEALRSDPKEYEKFCVIRDSALIYKEYKPLFLKCLLCDETSHGERFCPKLFTLPPTSDLIPENVLKKPRKQNRKKDFKRKRQTKHPCSLIQTRHLNNPLLLHKIKLGLKQREFQNLEIRTSPEALLLFDNNEEKGEKGEKGEGNVTDESVVMESEDIAKNASNKWSGSNNVMSKLNKEEYIEVEFSKLTGSDSATSFEADIEKKLKKEKVKVEKLEKKRKEYDYREFNDDHYLNFEFYFPHNNISNLKLNEKVKNAEVKPSKMFYESHPCPEFILSCEDRYNSKMQMTGKNNPKSLLSMLEQNLRQKSLLASRQKHKEADFSFSVFSAISNSQRAAYQI